MRIFMIILASLLVMDGIANAQIHRECTPWQLDDTSQFNQNLNDWIKNGFNNLQGLQVISGYTDYGAPETRLCVLMGKESFGSSVQTNWARLYCHSAQDVSPLNRELAMVILQTKGYVRMSDPSGFDDQTCVLVSGSSERIMDAEVTCGGDDDKALSSMERKFKNPSLRFVSNGLNFVCAISINRR